MKQYGLSKATVSSWVGRRKVKTFGYSNGREIAAELRSEALLRVSFGETQTKVCKELGLNKSTLSSWVTEERRKDPEYVPTARDRPAPSRSPWKVGEVRKALGMLDAGMPLRGVATSTGHDRSTLRRWRDEPRYREATLEFDPDFTYDENDLMDRAVVAHHLCGQTFDLGERLDLMFAVIGSPDLDDFSVPYRSNRERRVL